MAIQIFNNLRSADSKPRIKRKYIKKQRHDEKIEHKICR
jgi:hypothetical protein